MDHLSVKLPYDWTPVVLPSGGNYLYNAAKPILELKETFFFII